MATTYRALYEPNLPAGERYIDIAEFRDGWQVGGNQGGHYTCAHEHRTAEAAEKCGRRINRQPQYTVA